MNQFPVHMSDTSLNIKYDPTLFDKIMYKTLINPALNYLEFHSINIDDYITSNTIETNNKVIELIKNKIKYQNFEGDTNNIIEMLFSNDLNSKNLAKSIIYSCFGFDQLLNLGDYLFKKNIKSKEETSDFTKFIAAMVYIK